MSAESCLQLVCVSWRSSQIPVKRLSGILAPRRDLERAKKRRRGAGGGDFANPPVPFPSSRLYEDRELRRLVCNETNTPRRNLRPSPAQFFVALIAFLLKLSDPLKQGNPYVWTVVSRSSLARLCSRRLWRRSCWFLQDSVFLAFYSWLTPFLVLDFLAQLSRSLTFNPCSFLLMSSLKTKLLVSWLVSPARRLCWRCLRSLQSSLALLSFCLTGNSWTVLLRRNWRMQSWDSGVFSFVPFKLQEDPKVFWRRKRARAHAMAVGPWMSFKKNRNGVVISSLAAGQGNYLWSRGYVVLARPFLVVNKPCPQTEDCAGAS